MPIPIAHPAAAVPFRRWCPRYLDFVALVVGTLVPDLATSLTDSLESFAHTILGSFVFCLPLGLLTVWIYRQVRVPLLATLPNPHRDVLFSCGDTAPKSLFQVIASLLLGSWLHIAWDLFTHDHSWLVHHTVLSSVIFGRLPLNQLIWLFSSLIGIAIPLAMYLSLVRKRSTNTQRLFWSEWRAYAFWLGIFLFPLTGALPLTIHDHVHSRVTFVRYLAMYYYSGCYLTVPAAGFLVKYQQRRALKAALAELPAEQVESVPLPSFRKN